MQALYSDAETTSAIVRGSLRAFKTLLSTWFVPAFVFPAQMFSTN
jgi:hypothetical protein